jgi:lanthanide-dependent methanol dehydrogenase
MRYRSRSVLVGIAAMAATVASVTAIADPDLDQKMSNPANWATQAGDYANHRYSTLSQINSGNVGNLQVAWTLSTGVLRGHEGSPLVIGDMMYIHTPFPNNVYAVSLKDVHLEVRAQAGRGCRAGHVLRHRQSRTRLR